MRPGFGQAARTLLPEATSVDYASPQLAERAVQACEQLAKHLSRLLGETGVELLVKRSLVLATGSFPWLAPVSRSETLPSALRAAMEQQDLESIIQAFVAILSAFVGVLERLIGEPLVERLLDEVWPTVFTQAAKDTP